MKILNILIVLLVISIIISGGFLGYLIYTQNTQVDDGDNAADTTPVPTQTNTPQPTNTEVISDEGCANLFKQGNGTNNTLADIQFNYSTSNTGAVAVGDKITVKAQVLSVNPGTLWKGLELRMIFPCENLKFVKSIPTASGEYYAIDVDSEYDNIAEVHIVTTKDNFEIGDEMVELEFEVIETGSGLNMEIADSSIILDDKTQKFSLPTNKISL